MLDLFPCGLGRGNIIMLLPCCLVQLFLPNRVLRTGRLVAFAEGLANIVVIFFVRLELWLDFFVLFCFFETEFLCVALAILELTL